MILATQTTKFSLLLFIVLILSACNWEKSNFDERANNSSTKSIKLIVDNNKPQKGETLNLDIEIIKKVTTDSIVHEIVGVCFEVDGILGGACNGEPLPPCIELQNNTKITKDFGTYNLEGGIPKSLTYSLDFTCKEAKTVIVSAGINSHWIKPKLSANWYNMGMKDSNIEIVFK